MAGKIYVTSDLHFCHNRGFLYEPRGFKNVNEMNETIIKNFNSLMDWDDDLYILGDCFLNDNEQGIKLMRRLPGRKHIVWGNHDTETRKELMRAEGFEDLGYANILKYNGYHFYLSHYPTLTSNYDIDKPLRRRIINLCGHSHVTDPFQDIEKGLIIHVEVDAHGCYPCSLDQLILRLKSYVPSEHEALSYRQWKDHD